MSALLFGSISTVIDTSELQREAFNAAFAEHGLDWSWTQDEYRQLLDTNGGKDRIAAYAKGRGEDVDAHAVHATKSQKFRESLTTSAPEPRPGVRESVEAARAVGMKVALVTTTSAENVAAVSSALSGEVTFDEMINAEHVSAGKPDPEAFVLALQLLGEEAADCLAIEDNPGGIEAATAAGLRCIAFPNANTAGLDLSKASKQVDRLDPQDTTDLVTAG